MKIKWAVTAAAATTGVLLSGSLSLGGGSMASAVDASIPWSHRPVTVGTGFRLATDARLTQPVVSASGRWVAFATDAQLSTDDTDLYFDTYLRDRWTDTTTRISPGRVESTVMSADGHLIGGNTSTLVTGPPSPTWIYNTRTGVRVDLPPVNNTMQRLVGINNDGYFLTEIGEPFYGPFTTRAGRLLPDDTLAPMQLTPAGDFSIAAVTPSLRYAVVLRTRTLADATSVTYPVRIDMTTGAVIEPPADFIPQPLWVATETHHWLHPWDSVISRDGRFVAMVWEDILDSPQGPNDYERYWLGTVRIWDTVTNTWATTKCCSPPSELRVYGVLNDGRVITTGQNVDGWAAVVVRDLRQASGPSFVLSNTFDGDPAVVNDYGYRRYATRGPSQIATDINRTLFCTPTALSSADTNNSTDCYLMPFPATPPAT